MEDEAEATPNQAPVGDEEWVRRLRDAVAGDRQVGPSRTPDAVRGGDVSVPAPSGPPPDPQNLVLRTSASATILRAVRDLEARVARVEAVLRRMEHGQPRLEGLVDDVADAVVARLDARWARTVADEPGPHA